MPKSWRQSGTIKMVSDDIVVQAIGRGREVWYVLARDDESDYGDDGGA